METQNADMPVRGVCFGSGWLHYGEPVVALFLGGFSAWSLNSVQARCIVSRIAARAPTIKGHWHGGSDLEVAKELFKKFGSMREAPPDLQKRFACEFLQRRFPFESSVSLLSRRFQKSVGQGPVLSEFIKACGQAKPHSCQCALRAVFGAWPCTGRLPTETKACIFGCEAKDEHEHYWRECPVMRGALLANLWECSSMPAEAFSHPWGVQLPKPCVHMAAIMFTAFQGASRAHRLGQSFNFNSLVRAASLLHPAAEMERARPRKQKQRRTSVQNPRPRGQQLSFSHPLPRTGGGTSSRVPTGQDAHSASHTIPTSLAEAIAASNRFHSSRRRR